MATAIKSEYVSGEEEDGSYINKTRDERGKKRGKQHGRTSCLDVSGGKIVMVRRNETKVDQVTHLRI